MTPVAATLDGENGFGFVIGMRAMAGSDRDGARVRHRRRVGAALDAFRHGRVLRAARGRGRPDGDGVLQRLAGDAALGRQADAARHQSVLHGGAGGQASADHPRHVAGGRGARQDPRAPSAAARKSRSAMRSTPRAARPPTPRPRSPAAWCCRSASYKGSGLSMFMDIFGGVISGANFGGDVGDQYKAFDRPQDVGHFFLAMKPNLFVTEDDYRARIDTLIERMQVRAARRRLRRGAGAGRARGPLRGASAASPAFPMRRARSRRCRTKPKRAGIQPLVVADRPIAR